MALADLAATPTGPAHKQCWTCWALTELPPELQADLNAAMAHPAVRYELIELELIDLGYTPAEGAVRRHARGRCAARTKLRASTEGEAA